MVSRSALIASCSLIAIVGVASCQHESQQPPSVAPPPPSGTEMPLGAAGAGAGAATQPLQVPIQPRSGSTLNGTVSLTPQANGVRVLVQVQGAKPGKHGIHFHQNADCSAPDAASAGGHWNPTQQPHGLPPNPRRHLGDLGSIDVGPDGNGRLEMLLPGVNLLAGDPSSLIARSLVVHESEDTGAQPSGNSGARIGCAVIQG